jgi:hypothetical protein
MVTAVAKAKAFEEIAGDAEKNRPSKSLRRRLS